MNILTHIIFYTHLLGFAAVAGGLMAQLTAKTHKISGVIVNGARWQLISGLTLVGIAPNDYNMSSVGVKFTILLIILGISEALRKKPVISNKVYWLLVILVVIQTGVALTVAKQ